MTSCLFLSDSSSRRVVSRSSARLYSIRWMKSRLSSLPNFLDSGSILISTCSKRVFWRYDSSDPFSSCGGIDNSLKLIPVHTYISVRAVLEHRELDQFYLRVILPW